MCLCVRAYVHSTAYVIFCNRFVTCISAHYTFILAPWKCNSWMKQLQCVLLASYVAIGMPLLLSLLSSAWLYRSCRCCLSKWLSFGIYIHELLFICQNVNLHVCKTHCNVCTYMSVYTLDTDQLVISRHKIRKGRSMYYIKITLFLYNNNNNNNRSMYYAITQLTHSSIQWMNLTYITCTHTNVHLMASVSEKQFLDR